MSDTEIEECSEGADPEKGRWSATDMLLASLVDEVRRFEHLYLSAHVKNAGKAPEPLPRPGVRKGRKPRRSRLTDAQRRMMDPRLRAVPDEMANG
jgi:hypothetical protein